MYEMMTGRPPYDGESAVAVAIQHINGGAKMPSTLNPNIPGGLEQIIMKAMAHEPADRYATAGAMLYDMDEFRKNPTILFDYNNPDADMDAAARFFLHFFANVCFILNDLNAVVKRKLTYPFYLSCFLYS